MFYDRFTPLRYPMLNDLTKPTCSLKSRYNTRRLRVLRRIPAGVCGVFRLRGYLRLPHWSRSWSQLPRLVRQQRSTHDGHRQSNGTTPTSTDRVPLRLRSFVKLM